MSNKPKGISLTVKEKIQLHLLDYTRFFEEYSVPYQLTQSGIAEKVGIHLKHLSQYLKPLIHEGIVEERTAHIIEGKQRRKVCFLTSQGRMKASKIKDMVLSSSISYMTAGGKLREGLLLEVMERYCAGRRLMDLLGVIGKDGVLDIGSLAVEEGRARHLVDHTEEAPKVTGFVDRLEEIEKVLSLLDERKIIVIRGLAGIGKTALASAVCSKIKSRKNVLWHQTRKWDTPSTILLRVGRFLRAIGKQMLYEHASGGRPLDLTRVELLLEKELDKSNSVMIFDDFQNAGESVIDFFSLFGKVIEKIEEANILVLTREAVPFYDRRAVMISRVVGEIDLTGLDFESTKEWMESRGVENDYEDIYERTGGHPLFLELATSHLGRT
ncbi:MAG: ATP-binding protein [Thermoplasmata archaeon]